MGKPAKKTPVESIPEGPKGVVAPETDKPLGPGRIGLAQAVEEAKTTSGRGGARPGAGRKPKATKEAEALARLEQHKTDCRTLAVEFNQIVELPCEALAQDYDPFLPSLGIPEGKSFALNSVEKEICHRGWGTIFEKVIPEGHAETYGAWGAVAMMGLAVFLPRVLWVVKLRKLYREQMAEEAEKKSEGQT